MLNKKQKQLAEKYALGLIPLLYLLDECKDLKTENEALNYAKNYAESYAECLEMAQLVVKSEADCELEKNIINSETEYRLVKNIK